MTHPAIQEITIQGLIFKAPAPYVEGHVLTGNEANALNQTFGENLRNNFAKRVSEAKEAAGEAGLSEATVAKLHSDFAAYAEGYEFGTRRQSTPKDPVMAEAMKLARAKIVEKIRENGKKVSDYAEGTVDKLAEQLVASRPWFKEEAERRVAAIAESAAADVDLGELQPAEG